MRFGAQQRDQRLIYQGRQLAQDDKKVGDYGIEENDTVHLWMRLRGGAKSRKSSCSGATMKTSMTLLRKNIREMSGKPTTPRTNAAASATSKVTTWKTTTVGTARSRCVSAQLPYAETNRGDDDGELEDLGATVAPPAAPEEVHDWEQGLVPVKKGALLRTQWRCGECGWTRHVSGYTIEELSLNIYPIRCRHRLQIHLGEQEGTYRGIGAWKQEAEHDLPKDMLAWRCGICSAGFPHMAKAQTRSLRLAMCGKPVLQIPQLQASMSGGKSCSAPCFQAPMPRYVPSCSPRWTCSRCRHLIG